MVKYEQKERVLRYIAEAVLRGSASQTIIFPDITYFHEIASELEEMGYRVFILSENEMRVKW